MYVPTGMVFGSNTSAGSWDPFRRAAAILAQHFHSDASLITKHKDLLDVLEWQDDQDTHVQFVKAIADKLNCGVLDEDGNPLPNPHNICAD